MSNELIEAVEAAEAIEAIEAIGEEAVTVAETPVVEAPLGDVAPPVIGFVGSVPAWPTDDDEVVALVDVPADEEIVTVVDAEVVSGEGEQVAKPRRAKK